MPPEIEVLRLHGGSKTGAPKATIDARYRSINVRQICRIAQPILRLRASSLKHLDQLPVNFECAGDITGFGFMIAECSQSSIKFGAWLDFIRRIRGELA